MKDNIKIVELKNTVNISIEMNKDIYFFDITFSPTTKRVFSIKCSGVEDGLIGNSRLKALLHLISYLKENGYKVE